MTADWKEPLQTVVDLLKADYDSVAKTGWNRANTDNVKPIVLDIASDGPERGKRLDLQRHDYILCYETALNEDSAERRSARLAVQLRHNTSEHHCRYAYGQESQSPTKDGRRNEANHPR
jgi:hypothetical protein